MKKYNLSIGTLVVNEELINYLRSVNNATSDSKEVIAKFKKEKLKSMYPGLYVDESHTIVPILESFFSDMEIYTQPIVERFIKYFRKNEIYDITGELFREKYAKRFIEKEPFGELQVLIDKVNELYQEIDERQIEREIADASRGRIVGGGFGVKGAVKGMVTASVMNSIRDSSYRRKMENEKSSDRDNVIQLLGKLKDSEEAAEIFSISIANYVACLYGAFNEVNESLGIKISCNIDTDRCKALIESAKVVPERRKELLLQAINLDPTYKDVYFMILENYGDETNALQKAATDVLGLDLGKDKIVKKCFDKIVAKLNSEQELIEYRPEFAKEIKKYGYSIDNSDIGKSYDSIIENYNLRERTVCGVTFNTKEEAEIAKSRVVDEELFDSDEEANIAKKELAEIKDTMSNLKFDCKEVDQEYENNLLNIKKKFEALNTRIKRKYIDILDINLQNYDKVYRTVTDENKQFVFDTREQADTARKEVEFIKDITKDIKYPNKDCLLDYKENLLNIMSEIESKCVTKVKDEHIATINIYIRKFDEMYLDTGFFGSKTVEDASRKKFKEEFRFNEMDLSTYKNIDDTWKKVDEFLKKIKMNRNDFAIELMPLHKAEDKLNCIDGCQFKTREEAAEAKIEFEQISEIMDVFEYTESIDLEYEKSINDLIVKLDKFKTCVKDDYIEDAKDELEKFDLRYRTVDGIVFETRELADDGRKDFTAISALLEGITAPDKHSMLDYEENVKNKIVKLQQDFNSPLADKYIALLNKYLADFDVKFRKVSLFGENTREEAAQKRLKSEMSHLKFSSWEDVDNAKNMLDDLVVKLGIDRNLVPEYDKMIEDNEKRLKTIDGIYFETRDEADFASSELAGIKNDLADINPPKKTDLLDYEIKVKEKLELIEQKYTSRIKVKYIDLLNKYLADFVEVFCQISLFKKGSRKEAAIAKALKFVKGERTDSTIDVENVRTKLVELLPKLGLEREEVAEAEKYLDDRKNEIINGVAPKKFGGFFKR